MNFTNRISLILVLVSFLMGPLDLKAQHSISGTVTDVENEEVLPGVNVLVKGTTIGTATNAEGKFSVETPSPQDTLVFSFIGFQTQEIPIDGRSTVDISLASQTLQGGELVVVGYGTQRKENVTSAISSVSEGEFTKGPVNSPLELLGGKVSGVAFSNPSGDPSSDPQITIRGVQTLASSSNPLVVIDGIPGGNLDAIAPEDIKSINILKGGSAAAIYGSRANAGVIIVNTKSGKNNEISVEYSGTVSIEEVQKKLDVLSASQLRSLPKTTGVDMTINDRGYSTNWQNEILRKPVNQVQHLSLYGGDKNSNYSGSLTYRDNNGIMLTSNKRSVIARLTYNRSILNDRLSFNMSLSDNISTEKNMPGDNATNPYLSALAKNPTDSLYFPNGNYMNYSSETLNPVGQLKTETAKNRTNQLLGKGKITAEPIDNLNISVFGSYQRSDNGVARSTNFMNSATTLSGLNGQTWLNGGQNWNRTVEVTTTYAGSYKEHNYTILGGYSYQDFNNQSYSMYAYDFPTDRFGPWDISLAKSIVDGSSTLNSNREGSKLAAFFGRINYDFNNKYLLMASLRREGSTKFGRNHKWGLFPAASGGWRISSEPFMDNIGFIDNLKLRVGYGVTGAQPDVNYLSQALLNYTNRSFMNDKWLRGVKPASNPNPDLRWEKKKEWDIGLDFTLLNNIDGSVDYYHRKTEDLLYLYNVPVPPNLYNQTWANVGDILNEGIEVSLDATTIQNKSMSWNIGGTYSYNANKLLKFSNDTYQLDFINAGTTGSPIQQFTHRVKQGQPIGNFFGWKSVAMDETGDWLIETPEGEIIPVSEAGDGDKQIIGNGIPNMRASFFTSLKYRSFDFSLTIRGAFQYQILNQYRMQYETLGGGGGSTFQAGNYPATVLQKPYGGDRYIQGPAQYVSYYIENGDYVKISNASIGYSVPFKTIQAIRNLRIYLTGRNIYTFTGYKGLNPEVSMKGLDPGIDYSNKYPSIRTFSLGVQLSL